jgi:hypothetical protein
MKNFYIPFSLCFQRRCGVIISHRKDAKYAKVLKGKKQLLPLNVYAFL